MVRLTALILLLAAGSLFAQQSDVKRHFVRSLALEGNLAGDSPERLTSVYLPPSYHVEPHRRFPVVYMLHGFTDSESQWMGHEPHWINLPEVIDRSLAAGPAKEMIVVMPNAHNRFFGSMYSKSVTIGDWETFIAEELVTYVDSHYRSIPDRRSRGLAGHSMGGYGAMRIGMKRTDVFSALYLLSPCCLSPGGTFAGAGLDLTTVKSFEDLAKEGFGVKAFLAGAAAWTPDPTNPPFFVDLSRSPGRAAKTAANSPLALLDQYVGELENLEGLAFDAGDEDTGIAAAITELDRQLDRYDIEREFEVYPGDHTNRVAERIEKKTLPFFSQKLAFE